MKTDIKTYIFFRNNNDASSIKESLSLSLFIPTANVIEINEDYARQQFSQLIRTENIDEPFHTWIWPYIKNRDSFFIFGIKKLLSSDQKLINIFKDSYMGVVNVDLFPKIKACIYTDNLFDTLDLLRDF